MNVIGLNETALRSLTATYTESGAVFGSTLFLFDGQAPNNFNELNFSIPVGSFNDSYANLSTQAKAMADLQLSVSKESGKIKLKATNGNFGHFREKGDWFKPLSTQSVYVNGAWTTLGDMVMYYPTGIASVANSAPGLPTPLTETQIYASKRSVFFLGALAHKTILYYGHSYALYFGHRNFSSSSNYGGGAVSFREPVDADFAIVQIDSNTGGGAQATAAIQYMNMSNQWVTIPSSTLWLGVRSLYGFSFPKTKIKGLRCWSQNTTDSNIRTYHITSLTAGLKDYASDPTFNPVSPNATYGLLMPNEDTTTQASVSRKPLMLLSVGSGPSNELILNNDVGYLVDPNLIVAGQTILELEI